MKENIRRHAALGMLAGFASAIAVKALTLLGQIASAHYLLPSDYGTIAPALSVASIAGFFAVGSWGTLLLQAPKDIRLRSALFVAGTWLSFVPFIGIGVAALSFESTLHGTGGLALLLVVPIIFSPLTTLYAADLQIRLRFRRLSTLQFLEGAASTVALVGLAVAGAGAYAIAAFRGFGAAAVLPLYRLSTGKVPLVSPTAKEVVEVTKRGALMSGYVAFAGLSSVAPGTLIAMNGDLVSAGVIVWSLQFAMQLPIVIGFAARQVHMSVASNMPETGSLQFWHSDIHTVILASFAACLFQALIAPLLIPIIFPNSWQTAIVPVQTLSIAQVLLPLVTVSVGNALVRGRLWHVMFATAGGLAVICGGAAIAIIGRLETVNDIATCVSAGYLLANLASFMILAALEGSTLSIPSAWALGATLGGFAFLVLLEVKLNGTPGTALHVGLWTTLAAFCVIALAEWRKIFLDERS
jgi:hypothetical protein